MRALTIKAIVLLCLMLAMMNAGCAAMDKLTGAAKETPEKSLEKELNQAPRFSETSQYGVPTDRQYRRWTRSRMEEESDVGAGAGSTWVMDGQGAYLFAQNKTRREGDVTNVKLEGPAMKQVETKVSVIKKLLKQLEEQEKAELAASRGLASEEAPGAKPDDKKPAAAAAPAPAQAAGDKEDKESMDSLQSVPSRIVERLADGNYRIKGAQPFMIGKREYKVIVTGMIRPEDYNDEGISSQKLLDPQYDVVSIRRNKSNE